MQPIDQQQAHFINSLKKVQPKTVEKFLAGRKIDQLSRSDASYVISQVLYEHPESFWRKGSQRYVIAKYLIDNNLDEEKTFEAIKDKIGKDESLTWKIRELAGGENKNLPIEEQVTISKRIISSVKWKIKEIKKEKLLNE